MTTKLTLTLQQSTIESAKEFAEKNGRSLSAIVESYLKILTKKESNDEISPKVKNLLGVITLPKDFDYKNDLLDEILKKHAK